MSYICDEQTDESLNETMAAGIHSSSALFNTFAYSDSNVLVANNSVVNFSKKSKQRKEGKFRSVLFGLVSNPDTT